ncbi:hypothetical protein VTO42DRAFT_8631 [Malbranchea cinnamomea]
MVAPDVEVAVRQNGVARDGGRLTRILPVLSLNSHQAEENIQNRWAREIQQDTAEARALLEAAEALRTSDIPVAFPTETVYGLGADATRSAAVRGIYKAKQRPSDNPLIVHVSSRDQLEKLLRPPTSSQPSISADPPNTANTKKSSLIPAIYEPLIARFWPGPLTILVPNPPHSPLAPEVTSSLPTFGVRIPSSPLARLLIHLADRPLAAPSANASTKPSPTTAQHVYTDLRGRIDIILDGGPCGVGVESTVVDGLSNPPAILRPGGIGIEEIRACPGWEDVRIAYKDGASQDKAAPRAPGMKYRHYSPKAKVVLFESGRDPTFAAERILQDLPESLSETGSPWTVGVVRTKTWPLGLSLTVKEDSRNGIDQVSQSAHSSSSSAKPLSSITRLQVTDGSHRTFEVLDLSLGSDTHSIARGLFSALRSLDEKDVSVIYVEGISDTEGDLAAAIMNRLRKAAEEEVKT